MPRKSVSSAEVAPATDHPVPSSDEHLYLSHGEYVQPDHTTTPQAHPGRMRPLLVASIHLRSRAANASPAKKASRMVAAWLITAPSSCSEVTATVPRVTAIPARKVS
jgi:hypothetical protein